MEVKRAVIVLADISGYTKFVTLHTMSLLHAEKIVTELLESIIDSTGDPLVLNKMAGDSVLFYAESGESNSEAAKAALEQALIFFERFSKRSKELTGCKNMCPCDACSQADQLRLKTILHQGEIAVKQVRGFEEIAGEAVIASHRLLKNSLPRNEYVLMTQNFLDLLGNHRLEGTFRTSEKYDGLGEIPVEVFYPPSDPEAISNPDGSEPEPEKQKFLASFANACRLNIYGILRTLRLKRAKVRLEPGGKKPGFLRFIGDMASGLWMLVRGKTNR